VSARHFKIRVSARDDGIGRNFYFSGEYGLAEIDKAFDALKRQEQYRLGTLLDIGANIGHVTLYCLSRNLSDAALCIEPDGLNFGLLQQNVELNKFRDNVCLRKIALGSQPGKAAMILSADNFGDHRIFTANEIAAADKYNAAATRAVADTEIVRLDDLAAADRRFENVTVVSLDVQGFELEVLKGGAGFFSRGIPLIMEVDPYLLEKKGADAAALYSVLGRGYDRFVDLSDGDLHPRALTAFPAFYADLKAGRKDYADLLFTRARAPERQSER
jgi:FkbM family methyltransferase